MDHKEFLSSWFSDFVDIFATNIWKIAPFRARNRAWFFVMLKAYVSVVVGAVLLACVLNSIEGKKWVESDLRGHPSGQRMHGRGKTALDECIWFVITTIHGIAFGEFNARGVASRFVAMACVAIGYWFPILLSCIVMLSMLPGEDKPSLCGVVSRMVSAVWPSYIVFLFITLSVGSMCGPYISHDPYGRNEWPSGMYWMWTVVHRAPFGDIWPETSIGRTVTFPAGIMGMLYIPYALALVAVRCPSMEQHESLLGNLRKHPENALGRGYEVPKAAGVQEQVMQEYSSNI